MSDTTTIRITKDLRHQLAVLGSKDDTFEAIIRRLLEAKGAKQ